MDFYTKSERRSLYEKHESCTRPSYDSELLCQKWVFRGDKDTVRYTEQNNELERWGEEDALCTIFKDIMQKQVKLIGIQDDMFKTRQKYYQMGLEKNESHVLLPYHLNQRQYQKEIKDLEYKLKMASRSDFQNRMVRMSIDFIGDIINHLNKRSTHLENELLQEQKKFQEMKNERDSAIENERESAKRIVELKNSNQMLVDNVSRKNNDNNDLLQKNTRLNSAYQDLDQYVYDLKHQQMIGDIGDSSETLRLLEENHKLQKEVKYLSEELMKEKDETEKEFIRIRRILNQTNEDERVGYEVRDGRKIKLHENAFEHRIQIQTVLRDEMKENEELRHGINRSRQDFFDSSTLLDRNRNLEKDVEKLNGEIKSLRKEVEILTATANLSKNSEYQKLRVEVDQLHRRNQSLKDELIHEKEKVQSKEKDICQMTETQKEQNSSIKAANGREKLLKESNVELKNEIKSLREKVEILTATANSSEQECIRVKQLLKLSEEEINSLKDAAGKNRQLLENISKREINEERLRKEKNKINEDLRLERESTINTESYENTRVRKENEKLQHENKQLHHELKTLKEELMHEMESAKLKENEYKGMQKLLSKTTEENKMKKDLFENTEYQKLRIEVDQLHRRNQSLKDELICEKGKVQSKEKDLRQMTEKQKEQYSSIQAANGREKMLKESNVELKNEIQRLLQENINLTEKLRLEKESKKNLGKNGNTNLRNQNAQQQLEETRDQLKHVQRELDDTKSRLSRAMGDRLTDNNPNIADLSDKNRPTKISERFQELYDNQWTDAFEIINETCMNEENTINVLRSILMDTLEYCKEQAANQMIQIKQTFLKGEEIPVNVIKQVKECRKAMAELYGKGLYKEYCTQLGSSDNASLAMKTPKYVKECFEICWLMAVQDPPVILGPQLRRNDVFNKDQYKAYTKSGDRVEFVVWPVLLLHQNGPVLCKGVAQGK